MPDVQRILLPVEEWDAFSKAYSGDLLSDAKKGEIVGVRFHEFQGFLYTVVGVLYGGLSGDYVIFAWQLLPEEFFENDAFISSEQKYRAGLRVRVKSRQMVFHKRVDFFRTLPSVNTASVRESCQEQAVLF